MTSGSSAGGGVEARAVEDDLLEQLLPLVLPMLTLGTGVVEFGVG